MPARDRSTPRFVSTADDVAGVAQHDTPFAGTPLAVAAFFCGWMGAGLLAAWILIRRGHDRRTTTVLGLGLGPLLLALLTEGPPQPQAHVIERGADGDGHMDVLIVLHSDPSAIEELKPTLLAVSDVVRRAIIVTTIRFETVNHPDGIDEATARLVDAAARIGPLRPTLVVLCDDSSTAATRYARAHAIDLTLHARP